MSDDCIIDEERIREDLGDETFAALDYSLRQQWAAEVYFFKQKLARIKAASDRIERSAEQATGFRNTIRLDPFGHACLNRYHWGWWEDAKSFEKDLARHHPECVVKVDRRTNFVGWTPSLNDPVRGQRHQPRRPKQERIELVLTDKRGNAA
jgi:hypothetical protein